MSGRPPVSAADRLGMAAALREAEAALEAGEVPVGAALVHDGVVVARAHNRTRAAGQPMAHAEMLVLQQALDAAGDDRLNAATLYITLEPCAMCAGAIVLAKVGRVVFGAWEPKTGMAGSIFDLLREPRLNHQVEVLGGVEAAACGAVLRRFFASRRGGEDQRQGAAGGP